MMWNARTRRAVPTSCTPPFIARLPVAEGGVQHAWLAAIDGSIGRRRILEGEHVAGENLHRQLLEQPAGGGPASIVGPRRSQPRRNRAHLGTTDGETPSMELTTQGQRDRPQTVPGGHQGGALVRQEWQGGRERGRIAAHLHDKRYAGTVGLRRQDPLEVVGA